MSIRGIPNWCLEYSEHYRREHPPTCLWLTITTRYLPKGLLDGLAADGHLAQKQLLLPLDIPLNVEKEDVLAALERQVVEIAHRLSDGAGGS